MAATSKGKRWEILHSLWVAWTFTFGFFNWIAFFYIGFRAKQRKWILWGLIYSVPFILVMASEDSSARDGWLGTLIAMLTLGLGAASIVHAFLIRKEYLIRLEALQSREPDRTATLKRQVETEYGLRAKEQASNQNVAQPQPDLPPRRDQERSHTSSVQTPDSAPSVPPASETPQASTIVDLNNSSERELATLPGIGIIVAKRAIGLRETQRGFRSVEGFGEALNLKPHVVERIRPLVSVGPLQQDQRSDSSGRVVDF